MRVLLLLVALAAASAHAQSGTDEFFPLALGNRWDYAWTTTSGAPGGGTTTPPGAGFTVWTVVAEGTAPGGPLPRLQIEIFAATTTTRTVCAVERTPSPSDSSYVEIRFVAAEGAPCEVAYRYESAPVLYYGTPGFYVSPLGQMAESLTIGGEEVPNRLVAFGMTDNWGPGTGYNGGSSWRVADGIGLIDFAAFQTRHGGQYDAQNAELRYARVGAEEYGAQAVADEGNSAPIALRLSAGPTPFRGSTTIRYSLALPSELHLIVTDALGRIVRRADLGARPAGAGEATLSADGLAPGVYVARLTAGPASAETRIVVVR